MWLWIFKKIIEEIMSKKKYWNFNKKNTTYCYLFDDGDWFLVKKKQTNTHTRRIGYYKWQKFFRNSFSWFFLSFSCIIFFLGCNSIFYTYFIIFLEYVQGTLYIIRYWKWWILCSLVRSFLFGRRIMKD